MNTRYNMNVSSPLYAGRSTSFVTYFDSDESAIATALLIEAQLENNAKVQVSKVIREPVDPNADPPRSNECFKSNAVDCKVKVLSFCNSDAPKAKETWKIFGLKSSSDPNALAQAIVTQTVKPQTQTGEDLDTAVSADGGIS